MRPPSDLPGPPARATAMPRHVPAINGLRGVAILAVIYFHVILGMWSANAVPLALSPLLTSGWTGVNLFFILSGFVLFLPYALGDRPLAAAGDRLGFYRRRGRRLLPLFYVAVLVQSTATAQLGLPVDRHELLSVLSLGFILDARHFGPSFNSTLWSIGVEIAFSALFPLLVAIGRRRGLRQLLAAAAVLALAFRMLGAMRYPEVRIISFDTDMFACRLDEFVLGMAAAQCYASGWRPRRPRFWMLAGVVLVAIAWTGFDWQARGLLPPLTRAVFYDVLDAGFFAILLAALVPGTGLAAAFAWRPLQVLGMMCYSIYIWHWPLLVWLMPDRATMPAGRFAAALASYLLLTLAIAALSYRFVEFARLRAWRPLFLLPEPAGGGAGAPSPLAPGG